MNEKIAQLIDKLVRAQLAGVDVRNVTVTSGMDADGDPILNISIILGKADKRVWHPLILDMTRKLRAALVETAEEDSFPIVRYLSQQEIEKHPAREVA